MESRLETPIIPRPGSFQNIPSLAPGSDCSGEAIAAIEHVGPRTYRFELKEDQEEFQFITLGCHGAGANESQRAVAKLMDEVVDKHKKSPHFVLFLGDNVYDWGVNSPTSLDFKKVHHDIYDTTQHISKLPCFMILGNHDENYQNAANRARGWNYGDYGYDVGKHQVAHTYVENPNALTSLFSQETLNPESLSTWVMPYFFYSIIVGNTQIFCLNSNRFLGDFYNHIKGVESPYPNQARWLVQEYKIARLANRQVIIAQHHPLSTDGKRSNPDQFDSRHYYSNEEIRNFNACLRTKTYSFNQLLAAAFMYLNVLPDAVLAAHDHFIRYARTTQTLRGRPLPEFTAGGGGGKLTHRVRLDEYPNVACHFTQFGFGLFTIKTKSALGFELDIYTTQGLHLKFNHQTSLPICNPSPDPKTEDFKIQIRNRCDKYLKYLKKNQSPIKDDYNEPMYKSIITFFSLPLKTKQPHEHNMMIVHNIVGLIDQHESLTLSELKEKISAHIEEFDGKEIEDSIYQQLKQILNPLEQLNTFSMN